MEICPSEKLTNVSHFISRGLFRNYKKDAAARRAAASMFWFKENQRQNLYFCETFVDLRFDDFVEMM
jgi:hypothetical protein